MKSILILNDKVIGGGAEIVMQNLVNYLHDKYKITVMTLDNDYDSFQKIFPSDVSYRLTKLLKNPYRKCNPLHYAIAVYNRCRTRYLQTRKYDILIANKEGPGMAFISKMRAPKKLAWVHVDYHYLYWTKYLFTPTEEVECMKKFDNVIAVSYAAANSIKQVIGDPGNLTVRYNPMDYRLITEKASKEIDLVRNPNKLLFVAVGGIREDKNYKTLVNVCAKLSKEFDFELWIVGDGVERSNIEKILQNINCSCVKILGRQSNPYPYMKQADLCVNASLGESYGLVIQEALVLGIPVLTTKCPAIEECFDKRFGIMVDCNEDAIETGLRGVLENPARIQEYRDNIQQFYDKTQLWDPRLREIENLLNESQ